MSGMFGGRRGMAEWGVCLDSGHFDVFHIRTLLASSNLSLIFSKVSYS